MNDQERLAYELGFRAGRIQSLLDQIERSLDRMIADSQPPTPKPTTTPERWWKRRPVWW